MKKHLIPVLLLITAISQAGTEPKPYAMPKTEVIPITDSATGNQYELYIKLPENYAENKDTSYPVIYFTDAVWHIEILSAATAYLMEQAILVGVSWQKDISPTLIETVGPFVSRFRDYSSRPSDNPERQAKFHFGQASTHLDFIRNDVIQYTEKTYRTDPANRTYFGYSMGGEFGAYALLTQPDTFKNYILGSPSLRSADVTYFTKLAADVAEQNKKRNARVFISYGTLEQQAAVHLDAFIDLLKNTQDKSLLLNPVVLEGSHQTAFPITAIHSVNWLNNLLSKESNHEN